jgi:hypothetical protein
MNKHKVKCSLAGGLGNYLFQIATTYAVAYRDDKEPIVDLSDVTIVHEPIETYFTNIFRKINFVDNQSLIFENFFWAPPIEYVEIPKFDLNTKLIGYFQNEKFFKKIKTEIINLFEVDESTSNLLNKKYNDILEKDTCSIHIRRGNYLDRQNYHPVLSLDYYKKAINIIGTEKHFLIFSNDINWCKENLEFIENKTFIENNKDFEDLYLMTMCNHNIIANSSFSWWGAWLNKTINKTVIHPAIWFGPSFSYYDTSGISCENWIKI